MSTQCLYDILQIPNSATDPEIKKAYRAAALASHPDKNPGHEAEAAEHFKQVQHAYAVLSDPHERAWYDSHRHQILRTGSAFRSADTQHKPEMADATRVDLFSCFSPAAFDGFGEGKEAFYGFYGGVFDRLWAEEVEVGEREGGGVEVGVSFGGRDASWETVRAFYAFWESFVSAKSFAFADKWNLAEAPNRDVRRLMEKENRKERVKLKKEFTSTVRELVAFVKKRDPRVALQRKEEEEEKERREVERVEKEKERMRLRKAGAADVKWMREKVLEEDAEQLDEILRNIELDEEIDRRERKRKGKRGVAAQEEHDHVEIPASDDVDVQAAEETGGEEIKAGDSCGLEEAETDTSDLQDLYCPACRKSFRTQAQMIDHERSKKHKAAVSKLRKQLLKEEKAFEGAQLHASAGAYMTGEDGASLGAAAEHVDNLEGASRSKSKKKKKQKANRMAAEMMRAEDRSQDSLGGSVQGSENPSPNFDERDTVRDDSQVEIQAAVSSETQAEVTVEEGPRVELTKKQKRKLREQRKKEQADTSTKASPFSCNVCKSPFPSRNKLMRHVEATGHALHVTENGNSSRRKR